MNEQKEREGCLHKLGSLADWGLNGIVKHHWEPVVVRWTWSSCCVCAGGSACLVAT